MAGHIRAHHASASVARAQLHATRRNSYVAQAVNAAAVGGLDAVAEVTTGGRQRQLQPEPIESQAGLPEHSPRKLPVARRTTPSPDRAAASRSVMRRRAF